MTKSIIKKTDKTPERPTRQTNQTQLLLDIDFLLKQGAWLYPVDGRTKIRKCPQGADWDEYRLDDVQSAIAHYNAGGEIGLMPASIGKMAIDVDHLTEFDHTSAPIVFETKTDHSRYHTLYHWRGINMNRKNVYFKGKHVGECHHSNGYIVLWNIAELCKFLRVWSQKEPTYISALSELGLETTAERNQSNDDVRSIADLARAKQGQRNDYFNRAVFHTAKFTTGQERITREAFHQRVKELGWFENDFSQAEFDSTFRSAWDKGYKERNVRDLQNQPIEAEALDWRTMGERGDPLISEFRLSGLIPQGMYSLVTGDSRTGKSTLITKLLAQEKHRGKPDTDKKVLWYCREESAKDFRAILLPRLIASGANVNLFLPIKSRKELLSFQAYANQFDYLVIDPIRCITKNVNDNTAVEEAIEEYLQPYLDVGTTIIGVTHNRKNKVGTGEDTLGAVTWRTEAQSCLDIYWVRKKHATEQVIKHHDHAANKYQIAVSSSNLRSEVIGVPYVIAKDNEGLSAVAKLSSFIYVNDETDLTKHYGMKPKLSYGEKVSKRTLEVLSTKDAVEKCIVAMFENQTEMPTKELKAEIETKCGISEVSVRRYLKELDITESKQRGQYGRVTVLKDV